jgi:hypothetical protein
VIDFSVPAGTRVVLVKDHPDGNDNLVVGCQGTVVKDYEYVNDHYCWLSVKYDQPFDGGHGCDGLCENGYGWNTPPSYLELLQESEISDEDILGIEELLSLMFA